MNDIIIDLAEGVLRVELNRPEKKNAMTSDMYTKVAEVLRNAAQDDRVRVVLWHGAGDAFTAGNDIEDFGKNPPGPMESPQGALMGALVDFNKPLIAAVRGAAVGGGTTMLLHCDFVFAGESTQFQLPFINLALPPEFGSTFLLPLTIGHRPSAELMLLGGPFDARRALELGLVTQVLPDKDLMAAAIKTAQKLAAKPTAALQASKQLLMRSFRDQIKAAMAAENLVFSESLRSEEAKEARAAFLEKRPPDFSKIRKSAAAA